MAEDNETEVKSANQIWSQIKSIVPEREVEIPESTGDDGHGEIESRIDSNRKPTDFQILDKRLNPDLGIKHLNWMQMGRTFPDVYIPLFKILVFDLIKNHPELTVAEDIAIVNTALSISIDGEGRIDTIKTIRETVEATAEKAKKDAGLL
jgi:hypothetical protein